MMMMNDDDCSICLGECSGVIRRLPCGHEFHCGCLTPWEEKKFRDESFLNFTTGAVTVPCPLCREPMDALPGAISKWAVRYIAPAVLEISDFVQYNTATESWSFTASPGVLILAGETDSEVALEKQTRIAMRENQRWTGYDLTVISVSKIDGFYTPTVEDDVVTSVEFNDATADVVLLIFRNTHVAIIPLNGWSAKELYEQFIAFMDRCVVVVSVTKKEEEETTTKTKTKARKSKRAKR